MSMCSTAGGRWPSDRRVRWRRPKSNVATSASPSNGSFAPWAVEQTVPSHVEGRHRLAREPFQLTDQVSSRLPRETNRKKRHAGRAIAFDLADQRVRADRTARHDIRLVYHMPAHLLDERVISGCHAGIAHPERAQLATKTQLLHRDRGDALRYLVGRCHHREPAITERGDPPPRPRAGAADQQWNVRLLNRFGVGADVVKGDISTGEARRCARPELDHCAQILIRNCAALLERDAEPAKLRSHP